MKDHIKTSFYYKHGRLLSGNNEDTPVKNITRPILNLAYRAEDLDVKDITLYIDDPDSYHLSFLIKKYHDDVFAVENNIDEFIDDAKESKIDYGGGLVKKAKDAKPEVIDLQSIAFCDQTDMMKGPIGFKHFFNPAELLDMADVGWGNPENGATCSLEDLIDKAESGKNNDKSQGVENKTPGDYIEIYEVHGVLPTSFLTDNPDDRTYTRQFQIIGFYKLDNGEKCGVTLFRKKVKSSPLKLVLRDKIFSRALGFGGAEELFEPQVWTTYDIIRQKELLDAASKVILKAVGADLKSRYPNGLKDMDNLQIIELNEGEDLGQVDTVPRSMALFDRSMNDWQVYAQQMGSATDPLLGEPTPGQPFRAQERQVIEGKGIHEYRRGKYAKFIEEVYRDWIIPHIVEQITNGTKFLSELSTEEMLFVAERVVENEAKKYTMEKLFNMEVVTKDEVEAFKARVRDDFLKAGNKRFIEVLKGEFKKKSVRVKVNVKSKQKDLGLMTDKLTNIFRQIFANPQGFMQVMQIPGAAKTFNELLEYSGLSPVYYSQLMSQNQPQQQPVSPQQENTLSTAPAL